MSRKQAGIKGDGYKKACLFKDNGYESKIDPKHIYDFGKAIDQFESKMGYFVHTGRVDKEYYHKMSMYQGKVEVISNKCLLKLVVKT